MFPKMVGLTSDEEWAITRVRLARYLGQMPATIGAMPYSDVAMVCEVMRADSELQRLDSEMDE